MAPAMEKNSRKNPAESACTTEKTTTAIHTQSSAERLAISPALSWKRVSRHLRVGLNVLLTRLLRHFRRERRSGRLLVPLDAFQVIAHVLLVERFLRATGTIFILRPESRRVWSQNFVGQHQTAGRLAKFEFRIGDDDAASLGVVGCRLINLDAQIAQLLAQFLARELDHALKRNVLIVTASRLRGRGEDRPGQFVGFT